MEVAGVDGCPDGWLLVNVEVLRKIRLVDFLIVPTFREVIAQTESCAAVGVDIPIGLHDAWPRRADVEARELLRPHRASSVFPSPVRAILKATTYEEACTLSSQACGKKPSKQTYAILQKIREVDEEMTPQLQTRVREVHPEVCFSALNGGVAMTHSKKTPAGVQEREKLLADAFDSDLACVAVRGAALLDDFLDACAAAWTAARIAQDRSERLPADPPVDERGLRMEIVY